MANLAEQASRLNWRGARDGWRGRKAGRFALVTDRARIADPLRLLDCLSPGDLVVLRDYDAPDRAALARGLTKACRARRLVLLVAGDLDLAVSLGVGLHLPEWRARNPGARVMLWHRRTKRTLSMAAHSRAALARAAAAHADLAMLAPVFATSSHADARPLGRIRFRRLVQGARLPMLALGGVTRRTILGLRNGGAAGIASVSGLTAR